MVIDMVYVCDNCGNLFSRTGKQEQCPDCGQHMVRCANAVEHGEFAAQMAELIRGRCGEKPRFPNMVETEIAIIQCFAFKLPATALQIDSDMILDILVEYGENSEDSSELTANVWARRDGGLTLGFLMPVHLPAKRSEPPMAQVNRIFAALNGNGVFQTKLFDFAASQLRQGGGG